MKFYGIDVQGYFKLKKYDASLPVYSASDNRRLAYIYNLNSTGYDAIYLGGEASSNWVRMVADDGDSYPNLTTTLAGEFHPIGGSATNIFQAQTYTGVSGNISITDNILILDSDSSSSDTSIYRNSTGGANITWNDDWYIAVGNQFGGTPTSGGGWTVFNTANTRGGGVATENWVDVNYASINDALTSTDLTDYYTITQVDNAFVTSTDAATRDITQWSDRIVYDEDGIGTLPTNATRFANIAEAAGVYSNAEGALHVVKRDTNGDIYARIGNLTAVTSQYADLAEKYTCNPELLVGTVVGVSLDSEYEVESYNPNMSGCIGVISENPALLMNQGCEGKAVALVGKVPVRVIGHINKGDFLIPYAEGLATKGDPNNQYDMSNKFAVSLETGLLSGEHMVICIIK